MEVTHPAPIDSDLDYEALMQETPGDPEYAGVSLDASVTEFLESGFSIVEPSRGTGWAETLGASDAGMTAHRGIIQNDEYVDVELLRAKVAERLGFTYAEIEAAYSTAAGRPSAQRASNRAHIDARLLALSRSGGNIVALAHALGWEIDPTTRVCARLKKALARARAAEAEAA